MPADSSGLIYTNPTCQRNQINFSLWFSGSPHIELTKTAFTSPLLPDTVWAVRGKTPGAFSTKSTFQWTSAVQAMSILMLRAAVHSKRGSKSPLPLLEGGPGSLANSLDAALYKQTTWLDLFGYDKHGNSLSRRVFPRTNPGRRRPGPVMVSLNDHLLPKSCIWVFINNHPIHDATMLENYATLLESRWEPGRPTTPATLKGPDIGNPLRLVA